MQQPLAHPTPEAVKAIHAEVLDAHGGSAGLRHEVDFLIELGRRVMAVEVKAVTRWNENDLSGLRAFLDRTPTCVAAVLAYNGREPVKFAEKLYAIPMGHLLA